MGDEMTKRQRLLYSVVALALAATGALWLVLGPKTDAAAQTTSPRTADGKPDFTGVWGGGGGGGGEDAEDPVDKQGSFRQVSPARPCHPGAECGPAVNNERDTAVTKRIDLNKPQYKPEHWERVQYADYNGNYDDLSGRCYPLGLPRQGFPAEIIQTSDKLIFLYGNQNRYRVIPIDGRPHDPIRASDLLWYGDPVGRWDGDVMVIESVGFTNESWLGFAGYLHGFDMKVIERFWREGDTLHRQITVEDPEYLEEPWVMTAQSVKLNPNQKAIPAEAPPCDEKDWDDMQGHTRERS